MKNCITLACVLACCTSSAAFAARPGTEPTPILPTALEPPAGCSRTGGHGLNAGAVRQVAITAEYCADAFQRPALWTASTGTIDLGVIGGATAGYTLAVSDDGTAIGSQYDFAADVDLAFARPLGGPAAELPKLAGMKYGGAFDISPNGAYIVGSNGSDTDYVVVRWSRTGGEWSVTPLPDGVSVGTVSNVGRAAGNRTVGTTGESKAVVVDGDAVTDLPGTDTYANGIDASGTVVVGYRLQDVACRRPPCAKYEIPMVWTLANGTWASQELAALDGVDSEAEAVARVGDKLVVVGYGYTERDAVMRAVYWETDAQGTFGLPGRLAGLDGASRAWARAEDVNVDDQVSGSSGFYGGSNRRPPKVRAVLWQVP